MHISEDDAEPMRYAAAYARRVCRKIGLRQVAFAKRIGARRKESPGPCCALLTAPQAALHALNRP